MSKDDMDNEDIQEFIDKLPIDRYETMKVWHYWGSVEKGETYIRAEPSENCNIDNPLVILSNIPIKIKPGQLLTICAACNSDDEFMPTKEMFVITVDIIKNDAIFCTIQSQGQFTEQLTSAAFTILIPEDIGLECKVELQCLLYHYHPTLEIEIDPIYKIT